MPFTNWAALEYWDTTKAASVTQGTYALAHSGDGGSVPKFATTAARDTAMAAFVAAGGSAEGLVCHVAAKGFYGYTQGAWRPNMDKRLSYLGYKSFSFSAGVDSVMGLWPDSGGFVGTTYGLAVPEDGIYTATLVVATAGAALANRRYAAVEAGGVKVQTSQDAGIEDRINVVLSGIALGAGNEFLTTMGHNTSPSLSMGAQLLVARIAA